MNWYKLEPSKCLAEILDMTMIERGEYFTNLIKDLHRGESENWLAKEMIEERNQYIEGKRLAGSKGAEARFGKKKAKRAKRLAKNYKSLAENSSAKAKNSSAMAENNTSIANTEQYITIHNNTEQDSTIINADSQHDIFDEMMNVWNKYRWTKKYKPSQSVRSTLKRRLEAFNKDRPTLINDFDFKLSQSEHLKDVAWFNFHNIFMQNEKVEKFLNGTYDFLNERTQNKSAINSFYGFENIDNDFK